MSYELLHKNARDEVLRNAGVMMEAALSMRGYTVGQVRPAPARRSRTSSCRRACRPSRATEIMHLLRKKYPDYSYKEAALNPTNPRNRAVDWESDIVNDVPQRRPAQARSRAMRDTPTGPLALPGAADPDQGRGLPRAATPTAEMAPPAMVKLYGPNNGFGWKLNEVIGAQIVSVPMDAADPQREPRVRHLHELARGGVRRALRRAEHDAVDAASCSRSRSMSRGGRQDLARATSTCPSFRTRARTRWRSSARSFNRMRRSLEKAIAPHRQEARSAAANERAEPALPARLRAQRVPHRVGCSASAASASPTSRPTPTSTCRVAIKEYLPDRHRGARPPTTRSRPNSPQSAEDFQLGQARASSTSRARSPRSATRTSCG